MYYLNNGNTDKYRAALQCIYHEVDIEIEINKPVELRRQTTKIFDVTTFRELFCTKSYRRMIRIGAVMVAAQQFSGINAILFYSSFMFQKIGISISLSRLFTLFLGISMLLSNFGTIILLKYIGRKTAFLCGQILLSVDLLIIGLLSELAPTATTATAIAIASCLFLVFFSFPYQGTLYTYLGEVQNKTALTFSTSLIFFGSLSILLTFPHAVSAFGVSPIFYFFSCCEALGSIYTAIDVIETKNKPVKDIQDEIFGTEAKDSKELQCAVDKTLYE